MNLCSYRSVGWIPALQQEFLEPIQSAWCWRFLKHSRQNPIFPGDSNSICPLTETRNKENKWCWVLRKCVVPLTDWLSMAGLTHKKLQRRNNKCLIYAIRVQKFTPWVSSHCLLRSSETSELSPAACRNTSKVRDVLASAWDFLGVRDILCIVEPGFSTPLSFRDVSVQKPDLSPSLDLRSVLYVLS